MDKQLRIDIERSAGGCCEYCHIPQDYDRLPFQVDHIIAEKHGGPTALENLAWSCFDCNIYKGPNVAGIDPQTGELTPLFNPRQLAWIEHFEWSGATLVGRTAIGRTTIAVMRINLERRVAVRQELQALGLMPSK